MAIKVTFDGAVFQVPSGNGPTTKTCPKCLNNKLYAQYGFNDKLDMAVWREFCVKKDNPCDYYKDNLSEEQRKAFLAQFNEGGEE